MPSREAMELAHQAFINNGLQIQVAKVIDKELTKARLEVAKAMLNTIMGCYNSGGGGLWNLDEEFMIYLRTLDPEQVINESVK